ncbi:hypothetical protein GCM10009809_41890 [Isoptericola hypogeus]|uniref:Tail sheath protein C-terminal domain-containing protein n=1 Tax=Isoptericola hypogeus TaxID=300179 RepID=A0ABP4W181_9MICO
MTETVLPGVYIEVRPEALIVPGAVTVGNVGVVGTASKGPVGTPQLLGSFADALARFGPYDRYDPEAPGDELTLVRALELAYRFGASTVHAVRVADAGNAAAAHTLESPTGDCVELRALSPGTWGNELTVAVGTADANAVVRDEEVGGTPPQLAHAPVIPSAVNRIVVRPGAGGPDRVLPIVYDPAAPGDVGPTQIGVTTADGSLTLGTALGAGDTLRAAYTVDSSEARKVTVKLGVSAEEAYTVVSGDDLVADLAATPSALVTGVAGTSSAELPDAVGATPLTGGADGAAGADYATGLGALLGVDAHLVVAAGQGPGFGDELATHVEVASNNENKRDRIAVVGTDPATTPEGFVQAASNHPLNSDRVVLVGPGIRAADRSQSPPLTVTLPGAYAAAAVAGMLSANPPHVSLTNKVLAVDGLEHVLSSAQLKQLVLSRVLALESRQGVRVVRGITTSTNTAWTQITTRRIVDFTKLGVRSAATPYIGLLNNERVRGALRASINGFLNEMVLGELLTSYELNVSATRDDEIRGIARVDMTIRPTFSIDFIKVTIFLE